MENHAKYGDTIYFHDTKSLYVNLFIPSELTWTEQHLVVRQETRFPEEDTTHFTITADTPTHLALKVRIPSWASGAAMSVNGQRQDPGTSGVAPHYATVEREWHTGDRVDVQLPMKLHVEAMPDDPHMVAVMYGPMVLAGDLGTEGLEGVKRYGPSAPQVGRVRTPAIPAFVASGSDIEQAVTSKIVPTRRPLEFKTTALGQPHDVTLEPLYRIVDERYTVYWNVYSPATWNERSRELAAADTRRKEHERRTIDVVRVDDAQSERDHGLESNGATDGYFEGRRTREARGGWFSYRLKIVPGQPVALVCTYRGSEGRRRVFDILVDGEKVATEALEYHPAEELDREYALPEPLTRNKREVTVRFQAQTDATAGALIDARTVGR
jgi:hypothetical protein